MRRADRLFEIIQVLRRAKRPLTAEQIATRLETTRWTIYRDIAALVAQRVPIRGEAGIGFVLDPGYDLPPLMLTLPEVEAAVLGAQWVMENADPALSAAAGELLVKLSSIVPPHLRKEIDEPVVGAAPATKRQHDAVDFVKLRAACRHGHKLQLRYLDASGVRSERTVWPFLVGYAGGARVLMAWCELRQDFRMFLTDRIVAVDYLGRSYPESRVALRRRWLAREKERRASS